jgi:hypothetical protein
LLFVSQLASTSALNVKLIVLLAAAHFTMDEALTWMETQSAKAFEDVCKVNENADLLPELLKVLLEHLRIVGLDLTRSKFVWST